MKINVLDLKGNKLDAIEFSVKTGGSIDGALRYLRVFLSNQRQGTSAVKTRAMVSGGGKKPWKQKGTGRARHGSTRSPIWRTGGITFGPTSAKNFAVSINKKMKRKALFMTLSSRVAADKFVLVDDFALSAIKTKEAVSILNNLKLEDKKTLVIVPREDKYSEKSFANIPTVSLIYADSLNIEDILKSDTILTSVSSVDTIKDIYKNYV